MKSRAWRRSSYSSGSSGQADCVELAAISSAHVGIRDSKDPEDRHLTLSAEGFAELLIRAKQVERACSMPEQNW
ncbi:DUF397 domain-containing protein [Actinomadura yumaensis]|nr:DUF397 domain-containing protein [Actinomadura sp. J1-007]